MWSEEWSETELLLFLAILLDMVRDTLEIRAVGEPE